VDDTDIDTDITDARARAFASALQTFERDADSVAFAELFADGATVLRFDGRGERTDVEQFWREYRDQFTAVSTRFTGVVQGEDSSALEWTSEGELSTGRPVSYRGATVIELDGDKITGLRTYYDSAVFTAVPARESPAPG
jgi:ketosteroid isomerase-like protein